MLDTGQRVRIETELNLGDVLHDVSESFTAARVRPTHMSPATGPIAILGAKPGDMVVSDIEAVEVQSFGVTALVLDCRRFPIGCVSASSGCTDAWSKSPMG